MDIEHYRIYSARTEASQEVACDRIYSLDTPGDPTKLIHSVLGMLNELGEVSSLLQKWIWYGKKFEQNELKHLLIEELGDILFHYAQALRCLDLTFHDVTNRNVEKLRKRYPDGFEESKANDLNRDK